MLLFLLYRMKYLQDSIYSRLGSLLEEDGFIFDIKGIVPRELNPFRL